MHPSPIVRAALTVFLVGNFFPESIGAQTGGQVGGPPAPAPGPSSILALVDGTVTDLHRDPNGRVLYCTLEREVGALDPTQPRGSRRTILATSADPFAKDLYGVAVNPLGQVIVVDLEGHLYRLRNGLPAARFYFDVHMILGATDLIIDAAGNHIIASRTPSSGKRATNFISSTGKEWDYFVVPHSPIALVADPLTDDVFMADDTGTGALRVIDGTSSTHPVTPVDDTTAFGFDAVNLDGKMVCEADGDLYAVSGGSVWFRDRVLDQTTLFASGFGQLRGITIAPSTVQPLAGNAWSLYLAEGSNPTTIREVPGVDAPASQIAAAQGVVPDEGVQRVFTPSLGLQILVIARDNDGNILMGGHLYQSDFQIQRYDTQTGATSLVAHESDGLTGHIQGIVVAPDDSIYALTRQGVIHKITENPTVVTTTFTDPNNVVVNGKSLTMDVNGDFYLGDRNGWGVGELRVVSGTNTSALYLANEARGISADPAGGGLFLTEWNGAGFNGSVSRYDFSDDDLTLLPGFELMNYSNGNSDGDTVVDLNGHIYTCSEDDWSVIRYEPEKQGSTRIGSGYLRPLSGVEIAPSTPGSGSTTGWSLYISDHDDLYEVASVTGPATKLVDSAALRVAGLTAALDPRHGKARDLIDVSADTTVDATELVVTTSETNVLRVDGAGNVERIAGGEHGLRGDLVGIALDPTGAWIVTNTDGAIFRVEPDAGMRVERLYDGGGIHGAVGVEVDPLGRILVTGASGIHLVRAGSSVRLSRRPALRAALDASGRGVVVTEIGGRLRRLGLGARARATLPLDRRGAPLLVLGRRSGELGGGIARTPEGDVLAVSTRTGRLVRLDSVTGASEIVSGGFDTPVAVAVRSGKVRVLDAAGIWTVD